MVLGPADWRLVEGIYRQLCRIAKTEAAAHLPAALPGFLAQALGRVSSGYVGHEAELADRVRQAFALVDEDTTDRPQSCRRLYFDERLLTHSPAVGFTEYNPPSPQRRRPTPYEAALETCRRLRDLHTLQTLIRDDLRCAAILGGSISYGRFINVRGASWGRGQETKARQAPETSEVAVASAPGRADELLDGSDTDLVLVLNEYADLNRLGDRLASLTGAATAEVDELRVRIQTFPTLTFDDHRMFSHKLPLWNEQSDPLLDKLGLEGKYILSLHIFSRSDFDHLLLHDLPALEFAHEGAVRTLSDYRPDPANNRADQQRDFAGSDLWMERPFDPVEHGFQARTAVCVINEGRYHPGMYQNLILPRFDLRWDDLSTPVSRQLEAFRWKIVERLRREKAQWPYERLRLSLSHTRSEVFAPHVVRSVDEGLII